MLRPLVLVLSCLALVAGAEPPAKVRLLAVGNSFSNNALRCLPDLAKAAGCELERTHLMIGGSPLELHWSKAEAALKDPADPKGRYGEKGVLGSLPEQLAKGPWDVVTFQQYSLISHDPATYRPFADKLVALVREKAPKAAILMHETWAYRRDDPRFGKEMVDAAEMHTKVAAAYRTTAQDLNLGLIPVGLAFWQVDTDPTWGFKLDPAWDRKSAQAPALPDQSRSLHVGFSWGKDKDGKSVLKYDGHHANRNGEYLGACVWFEVLFQRSVVGNAYWPKDMPEDYARFLQEAAHRAAATVAHAAATAP